MNSKFNGFLAMNGLTDSILVKPLFCQLFNNLASACIFQEMLNEITSIGLLTLNDRFTTATTLNKKDICSKYYLNASFFKSGENAMIKSGIVVKETKGNKSTYRIDTIAFQKSLGEIVVANKLPTFDNGKVVPTAVKEFKNTIDDNGLFLMEHCKKYITVAPRSKKQLKSFAFDMFFDLYGKKVGKEPAKDAFLLLSYSDALECLKKTPEYVASKSESKYKLDPVRFIKEKRWTDEIINESEQRIKGSKGDENYFNKKFTSSNS